MGESNKVRFFLFVSLMFFPAHALDVIISGAHHHFKQRSEIKTIIMNGEKKYCGTMNPLTYEAGVNISKVIVYIIDRSRYVEIIRNAVSGTRLQIADELKQWNCELVFLGIENFDDDEHDLIGAFMLERIQPHRNQTDQTLIIEVIGENRFDRSYQCHFVNFSRYRGNDQICGGTLSARLRAIPCGALRPVGSNDNKSIKLLEYLPPKYSLENEVTWAVHVVDDTYLPAVDVNTPEYNFRMHHPYAKIVVLVIDEREYSTVTTFKSSRERNLIRQIQRAMAEDDEVLYIMGAFNFDWCDVYLVTQIILKHTQGWLNSGYNVFACGFGMFNTYYLNWYEDDGRYILKPENSKVLNIMNALSGQEVKERAINMFYFENEWKVLEMPISLGNGEYIDLGRFTNFTFPWLNQRIAFIVYSLAEVNAPIDNVMLNLSADQLRQSNIYVVLIEAVNFELYDVHIIAEWVEKHKGHISPQQIAVLGGGTFDTIFQSQRTTFNTFFNIGKNEMRTIRNALVKRGNEKSVHIAKIDDSRENFKTWSYPMNTVVNGVYETDLIPDNTIFHTSHEKDILFIITSAYNFHQISAIQNVALVTSRFREEIISYYAIRFWNVFLVGLDNFGEMDSHLFAELVKMQTHDERPLSGFVRVFSYGIEHSVYQYKSTTPFSIDFHRKIQEPFIYFFGRECSLLDHTRSD